MLKKNGVYAVQGGFEEMSQNPEVEQVTPLKTVKNSQILYNCNDCQKFPSDGWLNGKPTCQECANEYGKPLTLEATE